MSKPQPIPKTTIVELRQQNVNAEAKGNGDYKVILDNPIRINEGDTINLKSAFIDSAPAEQALIEVEEDPIGVEGRQAGFRTISITTAFYLTNVPSSLETIFKTSALLGFNDGQQPAPADRPQQDTGMPNANVQVVSSKTYDPILRTTDPANSTLEQNAGRGRSNPQNTSTLNTIGGGRLQFNNEAAYIAAVVNQQGLDANNVRMNGKPYMACVIEPHAPTDAAFNGVFVRGYSIIFNKDITASPEWLTSGTQAGKKGLYHFQIQYYSAGVTDPNTATKAQSFTFDVVFNTADSTGKAIPHENLNLFLRDTQLFRRAPPAFGSDSVMMVINEANMSAHSNILSGTSTTSGVSPNDGSHAKAKSAMPGGIPNIVNLISTSSSDIFKNYFGAVGFVKGQQLASVATCVDYLPEVFTHTFSSRPFTRTTSFKIPARSYQPEELAKILTNNITSLTSQGPITGDQDVVANNGVLLTSRQMTKDVNPNFTKNTLRIALDAPGEDTFDVCRISQPIVYMGDYHVIPSVAGNDNSPKERIIDTFRLNDLNQFSQNYQIGAANFGIEWNDANSKYEITAIHTPFFDISPNTSGSSQIRSYTNAASPEIAAGQYPGLGSYTHSVTGDPAGHGDMPQKFFDDGALIAAAPRSRAVAGGKFWVNKYSGCVITDLQPRDLWFGKMKFDESLLYDTTTGSLVKDHRGQEIFAHGVPDLSTSLEDGVNMTGEIASIGATIQNVSQHFPAGAKAGDNTTDIEGKIQPFIQASGLGDSNNRIGVDPTIPTYAGINGLTRPFIRQGVNTFDGRNQYQLYDVVLEPPGISAPTGNPAPYTAANETQQIGIFASGHLDDGAYQSVDDPFYKIEVRSKVQNKIVGDNKKYNNFISSIISKYYNAGNFTSSYDEGSINYTHQGATQMIQEFGVRILNSEGDLASDIAARNSVFLEIVQNNPEL